MRLSKHPLAVAELSAQLPHLFRPVPYRGYLGLTDSNAAASTPYSVAMASQGHVDRGGRAPVKASNYCSVKLRYSGGPGPVRQMNSTPSSRGRQIYSVSPGPGPLSKRCQT